MANGSSSTGGFVADKVPGGMKAPLMECFVSASNDVAIGRGDAITPFASNTGTVTRAAAGEVILGVAEGVKYLDSNNLRTWEPFMAASKAGFVNVHWHPLQVYRVQGAVTALTQAMVFQNANHVDTGDTDATYGGLSRQVLGTITTTQNLQWKVIGYPRGTGGTNAQGGNSSKIGDTYPLFYVVSNLPYLSNSITPV